MSAIYDFYGKWPDTSRSEWTSRRGISATEALEELTGKGFIAEEVRLAACHRLYSLSSVLRAIIGLGIAAPIDTSIPIVAEDIPDHLIESPDASWKEFHYAAWDMANKRVRGIVQAPHLGVLVRRLEYRGFLIERAHPRDGSRYSPMWRRR